MASSEVTVPDSSMEETDKFPILEEYIPSVKFLSSIPSQALKGFRQIDISFTCLDICENYIAIGTNVGIVYLYDRKTEKLDKLRNDEYTNSVTCVKLLVSLECLVAVGTKKGELLAFKVPFENNIKPERFKVDGLHKTTITALAWARNGIKFFSGDSNGVVVCTEIDHLEHQSRSYILLEENIEIVQLGYTNLLLLISTLHRSLLYDLKKNESYQVGQKARKCLGRFGATFFQCGDETCIYACRPGQRICKSDFGGVISETIVLKSVVSQSLTDKNIFLNDFQFGLLEVYSTDFLLTWSAGRIVLVDLGVKSVKSIFDSAAIVDVATSNGEIFILQGIRNLIRLACYPEAEENCCQKGEDAVEALLFPMKEFHIHSKEDQKQQTDQDGLEPPKVLDWIKRKFSESTVVQEERELDVLKTKRSATVNVILPDIVKLDSNYPEVEVVKEAQLSNPILSFSKAAYVPENIDDDIVYRPKRKKKKKKKVDSDAVSGSSDSQLPSNPCDNAQTDLSGSFIENSQTNHDDNVKEQTEALPCDEFSVLPKDEVDAPSSVDVPTLSEDSGLNDSTNKTESISDAVEEPGSPFDIYSGAKYTSPLNEAIEHILAKNCNDNNKQEVSPGNDNAVMSTGDDLRNYNSECPKYGVEYVQFNAPGPLICLSASNHHVFCVDKQNAVYISTFPIFGFKWIKMRQPADQIAVSPSEHIVWILYNETIYAAGRENPDDSWKCVEWLPIARSVLNISVDDSCGWYISMHGDLFVNKGLSSCRPYNYPEKAYCPSNIVRVACKGDVVWLLSDDGKVYCGVRSGSRSEVSKWEELKLPSELSVSMVAFGCKKEAYIIGYDGTIFFRLGVTSLTPQGLSSTLQVESGLYVYQSCGQVQKVLNKVINSSTLHSLIHGQQPVIIASSEVGIWWCKVMDTVLYSYQKHIIGHSWDLIVPRGTISTTKWSMISAEGFLNSEGILWGTSVTGELICFSLGSTNCVVIDLPASASLKCVQSIAESLWVLTAEGDIYIRREMSKKCPQGVWWQQLDTTQLCDLTLCHISCSSEAVWACDTKGHAYIRVGTLNPPAGNFLAQAWIQVDPHINPPNLLIQKIYTGPKSYMVWAIDFQGSVYVRSKIAPNLLVGDEWVVVAGPRAKQLCISRNGVWLLKNSGKIFRRFGITKANPSGDYWKQIPGKLSFLSVTEDDNLWGVQDNCLCCHNSYTLQYENYAGNKANSDVSEDVSEDDWEDVVGLEEDE